MRKSFLNSMILAACLLCLAGCSGFIGMLNPKGIVTYEERKLFFDTLALMLIVVLPVIIMSFTFVYHYQVSHRVKEYKPNWSHSLFLEALWWGIPCAIILVLAILTAIKTHELDPFQKVQGASNQPPLRIDVIALPWKWLFIYPEQNIATLNYLVIPVNRQIEYWITTDNVPMSSFIIPQLGSQIYTMTGMRSRLHMVANETGQFIGMNTQFNGDGFSDMHFVVKVVDENVMQQWIKQTQSTPQHLTMDIYQTLLKPTIAAPSQFFSGVPPQLFQNVIAVYTRSLGTAHPRAYLTQ